MKHIKTHIFTSILLTISMMLIACHTNTNMYIPIEYEAIHEFVVCNESSHTISLQGSVFSISDPDKVTKIAPNKRSKTSVPTGADYGIYPPDYGNCLVTFDNQYSIIHSMDVPHSLMELLNYEIIDKGKGRMQYTFIFTDADYDYAVQWNMEHGGE